MHLNLVPLRPLKSDFIYKHMKRSILMISLLICLTRLFSVSEDRLVAFDVITTFEGEIDPANPPKLKTYIKANEKLYTIVNPDFSNAKGKVKFVSVLNQHMTRNGQVTYEGSARSELEGTGQLGTNIQTFDLEKMSSKTEVYRKFSVFLYKYLKYILTTGNPVDQDLLKDLYNNYVYFGALAKGVDPKNEVYFKNSYNQLEREGEVTYETKASSKTGDRVGGSLTYAVANLNDGNGENTLQQTFNVNYGQSPKNYLEMMAVDNKYYNLINSKSKSLVKDNHDENNPSFASVYSDGATLQSGISEQQSESLVQEKDKTIAFSKGTTSSIDKKKYLLELTEQKCDMTDYDGYKFRSVDRSGKDMYKKGIGECEQMKSIFNSL